LTLSSLARGFLLRAALSLFGLGIALLLGEAAVRWLHLGPLPLTVFRPHPTRMFALAPGREVQFVDEDFSTRVAISRDGLRNPPLAPPETAGRPRVLALGDSFTFGYGVETAESWPARLQAALREDGLPRAEVINAGVVAYAPDQQLDLLRELLPRSRPDAVILGLYVGNDRAEIGLHRSAPPLRVSPEGALLEFPTAADLNPHPIRLWIARHLRLYSFARVRIHRLLIRLDLRQEPRLYHPAYFLDALGSTDAYEGNWPGLKRLLRDMDRATRASGARFLLAILPMDVQVSERYWTHYRALGFSLDREILREARPQARLRAFATGAGIPVADLLPALRAHTGVRLYFRYNPNWTAAGQAEAAATLVPFLRRLLGPA
jgi:hypothetical protein